MRFFHTTGCILDVILKVSDGNSWSIVLTAAVLRAADLDASCLRGALPIKGSDERHSVAWRNAQTSGRFAGGLFSAGHKL